MFGMQKASTRPIHEATRRWLCRLGFVVLALLPVLSALALCIVEYVPAYQQARIATWEREVSRCLGVQVIIGRVDIRAPDVTILHNVELRDPESKAPIAEVPLVNVVQSSAGYALRLSRPTLVSGQISNGLQTFHRHFLSRPAVQNQVAVLHLENAVLRSEGQADLSVAKLRIEIQRTPAETRLHSEILFHGDEKEVAAQFQLVRQHTTSQQATDIEFRSGSTLFPGRLLSLLDKNWNHLSSAYFDGELAVRLPTTGWQARYSGVVTGIDASRFMSPPQIIGQGDLLVRELLINSQGVERASGRLGIRGGRISQKLLLAAGLLGVQTTAEVRSANVSSHLFEQMGLDFEMDGTGLRLSGILSHSANGLSALPAGTVLSHEFGPIATCSGAQSQSLGLLVIALSGATLDKPLQQADAVEIIDSPMGRHLVKILPHTAVDQAVGNLRSAQLQVHR